MQRQNGYGAKGFNQSRLRLKAEEVRNHFHIEPVTPRFLNDPATQFALSRNGKNDFVHEFCSGDTREIADSAPYIASQRQMFIEKPKHNPATGMVMLQGNGNCLAHFAGANNQDISHAPSGLTVARRLAPPQVAPPEHPQIVKRCDDGECENRYLNFGQPN